MYILSQVGLMDASAVLSANPLNIVHKGWSKLDKAFTLGKNLYPLRRYIIIQKKLRIKSIKSCCRIRKDALLTQKSRKEYLESYF